MGRLIIQPVETGEFGQSTCSRWLIFIEMGIIRVLGFLIILQLHRQDYPYTNALTESEIISTMSQDCKDLESLSPTLRLKRHLFCEYDSTVRPVLSHQTVNNVTMKLLPMQLEFDEWMSTMSLHSWLTLTWTDFHLTWTPSEFGGVTFIHVKSYELWVPDIAVYNSGDMSLDQNGLPDTNCLLFSTGTVSCVPSVKHTSRCATDFKFWPYDTHKCRITFGSWAHSGEEINIHLDKKGYQMDGFTNNTQWDFKVVDAYKMLRKFKCCPNDTYPTIIYEFSLSRHRGIMHTAFITPAIALMLLTLTVLWLDSRSTERLAVGSVNFVCHLICMFDLHWQLPPNGANPPNILLFYRDSLVLATFAVILTALLRKLQDMSIGVPYWISTTTSFVLNNRAGRFLVLTDDDLKLSGSKILGAEPEDSNDAPKTGPRDNESSWRHFAAIIEWLSFFAVLLTYVIILATLIPSA